MLAIAVPALALAGAYVSQYGFGLHPCEMCWWQRWPHFVALALALLATQVRANRPLLWLAALAIAVSGAIGIFHAGVEYDWWEGITGCATLDLNGGSFYDAIQAAPITRCIPQAVGPANAKNAGFTHGSHRMLPAPVSIRMLA